MAAYFSLVYSMLHSRKPKNYHPLAFTDHGPVNNHVDSLQPLPKILPP